MKRLELLDYARFRAGLAVVGDAFQDRTSGPVKQAFGTATGRAR